jgi:hypothetical protein
VDDQAVLGPELDRDHHAPRPAVGQLAPAPDQIGVEHVVVVEIELVAVDRDDLAAQRGGGVAIGHALDRQKEGAGDRARANDGVAALADPHRVDQAQGLGPRVEGHRHQLTADAVSLGHRRDLDAIGAVA